jgi:hypothetical protein
MAAEPAVPERRNKRGCVLVLYKEWQGKEKSKMDIKSRSFWMIRKFAGKRFLDSIP